MFTIDATNKACPLPVIETKKALRTHDLVKTTVDNEIATQNLEKMAKQLGYLYEMEHVEKMKYVVVISKHDHSVRRDQNESVKPIEKAQDEGAKSAQDYIVVVDTDVMGRGSDELGAVLLKGFIYSLVEQDVLPQKVIFYNGGVKLAVSSADTIDDLKQLANHGVDIYTCGACLDFYQLKAAVGEVTNMYRIVEMMREANKIVKP